MRSIGFSDGDNWAEVQDDCGLSLPDALFVRVHAVAVDGVLRARTVQPAALHGAAGRNIAALRFVSPVCNQLAVKHDQCKLWFCCSVIPESPRWLINQKRYEEGEEVLRFIAEVNDAKLPSKLEFEQVRDALTLSVIQQWKVCLLLVVSVGTRKGKVH